MPSPTKLILSCLIGNILEFYDFILFGIFADVIAQHFFPSSHQQMGLFWVFTALAVGYVARPLGGLLFGHFGDKYSRRKTLIISLMIMGCVTTLIGLMPGYASIGLTATVLLVLLRLVQGLTVGGESAGSMVFLIEQAPEKWRASLSICALLGAILGVLLALLVSHVVAAFYSPQAILRGAWRIPFLLSAVLAIVGVYLRSRYWCEFVTDSVSLPVKDLFKQQARTVGRAILFLYLPAVFTGFSMVYLVPYLTSCLHLGLGQAIALNIDLMLTMIACLFLSAYVSDRFQCYKKWTIVTLIISVIVTYPLLSFVAYSSAVTRLVLIVLTAILSLTMGSEIVLLAGFFKKTVRYSGVGFSHGAAFSIIAGTSPLIFNYLTMRFGPVSVAYYLIFAAVVSLAAIVVRAR